MSPTIIDSWVNVFKDGLTAISIPVTAFFAGRGLNTWRHQMKGAVSFELMRNLLRAVYKIRDAFRSARSPYYLPYEAEDYDAQYGGDEDFSSHLPPREKAQEFRMRKLNEAYDELEVIANEAEVIWDARVRQKLSLLTPLRQNYYEAIHFFKEHSRDITDASPTGSSITVGEMRAILFTPPGNGADAFQDKINLTVKEIEDYVRAKVK